MSIGQVSSINGFDISGYISRVVKNPPDLPMHYKLRVDEFLIRRDFESLFKYVSDKLKAIEYYTDTKEIEKLLKNEFTMQSFTVTTLYEEFVMLLILNPKFTFCVVGNFYMDIELAVAFFNYLSAI